MKGLGDQQTPHCTHREKSSHRAWRRIYNTTFPHIFVRRLGRLVGLTESGAIRFPQPEECAQRGVADRPKGRYLADKVVRSRDFVSPQRKPLF